MKTETVKYETGATSHAVNDLILFADNTPELAKFRDKIYLQAIRKENYDLISNFQVLYVKAVNRYKKEFPDTDARYFLPIGSDMAIEFCKLYADDFDAWKLDHNYK